MTYAEILRDLEHHVRQAQADCRALDLIQALLDSHEWNSDLWEPISNAVRSTGRTVGDPFQNLTDIPEGFE